MSRALIRRMNAEITTQRRALYGDALSEIAHDDWPDEIRGMTQWALGKPLRVWCSRRFIAILYEDNGRERLSICRAELNDAGAYRDGITWDELQRLKHEAGFGNRWAVEVYPSDEAIVCLSNMRHLWLLNEPPPQAWLPGDRA